MPFDNTTLVPAISPLAKLGITPVAPWVVEAHKKALLDAFVASPPHNLSVEMAMLYVSQRIVCWMDHVFIRWSPGVKLFLQRGHSYVRVPPCPNPVLNLGEVVARKYPGAEYRLEYFYDDPILSVKVPDHEWECLGIWDNSGVVQIADYDLPRSWWSRWLSPSKSSAI